MHKTELSKHFIAKKCIFSTIYLVVSHILCNFATANE